MSLLTRRGFSLIELMIALVLLGLVSAAVYKVLVNNQRLYLAQTQTIDLQQNIRAAAAILPAEFRELDAADGDITAMGPDSIRMRAMRQLSFLCATPPLGGGGYVLTLQPQWIAGSQLNVANAITLGAPVRGFDKVTYRVYQAADGNWYLGQRNPAPTGTIQPVVGPLTDANGVTFTYYDSVGVVTVDSSKVAQIQIVLRARTASPIRGADGVQTYKVDSVVTRVALRNNPRCGPGAVPPRPCG